MRSSCARSQTILRKTTLTGFVTGDLTDAKNADMLGSQQFIEEWATYSDILKHSGVLNKTVWLDIRGNHGMKFSFIITIYTLVY